MPVIGFLNSAPPMAIRPWRPHSSRAGLTENGVARHASLRVRHAGLGRPVQVILPQATAPWALHRSLGAGRSPTSGARGRRAGAGARRALRPGGCPAHSLCADSARCRAAPAGADQPSHCDGWLVDATLKRRSFRLACAEDSLFKLPLPRFYTLLSDAKVKLGRAAIDRCWWSFLLLHADEFWIQYSWFWGSTNTSVAKKDGFARGRDRAIATVRAAIQRLQERTADADEDAIGKSLRAYEGLAPMQRPLARRASFTAMAITPMQSKRR
jgi:hypothetical protein